VSGNDGVREVENLEGLDLRTNVKLPYFTAALAGTEEARKFEEERARLETEKARKDAEGMARLEAEKAHKDAEEKARAAKALRKAKIVAKKCEAKAKAKADAKAKAAKTEASR